MPRVLLQSLGSGTCWLESVARPSVGASEVLVAVQASVVSAGTERMLAEFGRASLIGKARQQPERVAEVITKARTDGIGSTLDAVRSKLDQPIQLGYSSAGVVVEVGKDVSGIAVGDRVATTGPHAEMAVTPMNLVVHIPDDVPYEDAAFATVASVAMQGIRLAAPTLGERFVVTGLGLVGLLTVQLLIAHGCSVLGIDPDPKRRARAEGYGATTVDSSDDVIAAAAAFSRDIGVDSVIVCASTSSSVPIHQAAQMCRRRGRIVLVGVTGLELDRNDFYEKELTFQVSASYGPGRYDPTYEAGGTDYPVGFVRWTAGRNMEAALGLMTSGKLDVASLVTHQYDFDDASDAYDTLVSDSSALGIVLRYPEPDVSADSPLLRTRVDFREVTVGPGSGTVGLLGAGNFATQVLLPAITAAGGRVDTVVSSKGTSASVAAKKFGARRSSSDPGDVIDSDQVDTVFVATRHDSHAHYTERCLRAGKHTFVEKPLAISTEDLAGIEHCLAELSAGDDKRPLLGIGFNRRFAPISVRMAELLATQRVPKALILTMNAGAIPPSHWTQDLAAGGGRIVGEACHMIDLARFLVGSPIVDVQSAGVEGSGPQDTASISLRFEDGSIATVHYFANGSKRFPKERVEAFSGGRVLVNNNFRTMKAYGWPGVRTMRLRAQDKGHRAGVAAFLDAVRRGGPAPIPLQEILEVSAVTLRAAHVV